MLVRRVLLVNHQPLFRAGLRLAVEAAGGFLVVGEAASGYQAMQEAERTRPNLLLIDIDLPGMSGCAIASALLRAVPGRSAVMLAEEVDHETYDRAVASGAAGAISTRVTHEQLVRTRRRVTRDQPLFWEPEAPPARQHRIGRSGVPSPGLTLR